MALLSSPRKQTVPLATGDERPTLWRRTVQPPLTKRVFFCSVVVENPEDGSEFPPELQDFVAQFGDPLDLYGDPGEGSASSSSLGDLSQYSNEPYARRRLPSAPAQPPSLIDPLRPSRSHTPLTGVDPPPRSVALTDVINELVATERSYVKRLRILRDEYAKPLREYSRTKDTLIIPPYEAKVLFGNIDQLLPINEAFLEDLEKMLTPDGHDSVGGVGDVALKHFKHLKGFECYRQYYAKREEAQAIFEREIKKGSQLATFIDRIKYATADARNRVGLRELLMEPVQRIPRYTLLFREIVKRMDAGDPQRSKLIEADEQASKIAQAVPDEQTKRAAMWYCFSATVEDFPANLVSNSRKFIDCIDVDDVLMNDRLSEVPGGTPGGSAGGVLHCSLLLFDDKLVILKRPSSERGVRALTGLEELEKSTKAQPFATGLKKSGIQYKGMVDLTEVVSTDVGGADFHVFLEAPPIDDSERWSGRPFRAYSVVHPPLPANLDPKRAEVNKARFLDNLWTAQARYRTKSGQSVVVATEEQQVENAKGRLQIAKTYFNIYQRTAFLLEQRKTKIVVQIDPLGSADPIPFGRDGSPYVIIRVQPMPGELSRYSVTSNSPNETSGEEENQNEDDIVQSSRVPERIVQTIHTYGLFNFRTGNLSAPGTPTASVRSKAAIFGLDAISRNLFHAKPGPSRGDIFGGSMNPASVRRSKTTASSRASVQTTQSTSSGDSSLSRWSRSRSNSTSATTASLHNSSMSSRNSRSSRGSSSINRAKKLIKRKTPPSAISDGSESEMDAMQERSASRMSAPADAFARSASTEPDTDYSDYYEDYEDPPARGKLNESERDLMARLELARKNSQNQHEAQYDASGRELRVDETIYESEWDGDDVGRPDSRASRASYSSRNRDLPCIPPEDQRQSRSASSVRPNSTTPTKASEADESSRHSRASSLQPPVHRLHGPRSPSPSSRPRTPVSALPSMDDELAQEATLINAEHIPDTPRRTTRPVSPLPRSKRQPFDQPGPADATPRPSTYDEESTNPRSVEPLVIRRKSSMQFHGRRKHGQRTPSMTKSSSSRRSSSSLRQTSSGVKHARSATTISVVSEAHDEVKHLFALTDDTKLQLASTSGKVQRIKEEYERMLGMKETPLVMSSSPISDGDRVTSPTKMLRTPPRLPPAPPKTREAQERMDEMFRLLKSRKTLTPGLSEASISRSESPAPLNSKLSDSKFLDAKFLDDLTTQMETELNQAAQNQDTIQGSLRNLSDLLIAKSTELERVRAELQNTKLQKVVIKRLFDDSMAEKEIMYEAFNEELDLMFKSVQQEGDEGWQTMAEELHRAKITAKNLEKEKSMLQHQLADADVVMEELRSLLRVHGLIP